MRLRPQKVVEGLDHRHRAETQLLQAPGDRHQIAPLGGVEQLQRIIVGQERHASDLLERLAAHKLDH